MPFITPLAPPPGPLHDLSNHAAQETTIANNLTKTEINTETNDFAPKIPRVCLDLDTIPDMMAAKLATSLLGHILFLKNQIPFPVLQLSRLPGGKSNSRAAKLKRDLIESFDTLSSHLDTTFTALSTAFARCSPSDAVPSKTGDAKQRSGNQAYMAILVGPSIGTAKSKVIFAVDGLETKIWGVRDDLPRKADVQGEESDDSDLEESDDEEDLEQTHEDFDDDDGDSRSEPEDSGSEDDSDADSISSRSTSPILQSPTVSRPSTSITHTSSAQDHAREQQKIRAADQLLSRTLAMADAEGRGMACELAPTQTHVLLRAPRRFSHPAWVPRPNFTNSMEHTLSDFLEETRLLVDVSTEDKPRNRRSQKQKVEGVWVAAKVLSLNTPPTQLSRITGEQQSKPEQGQDEADEMIWWSWDGKMVGFSSW
ncbi:hypothetical protein J3R30DRAFT_1388299 [Lentinula aciculospora]|uniref:Uncharacterized protein n=1 Tax=Lentinula aciculospora TaxID=153920 RepID=A0A9W9DV52_9AGAR|nr:hypothetical protein J3R30DRAFT_1388299 [Lentinula aciculospora]